MHFCRLPVNLPLSYNIHGNHHVYAKFSQSISQNYYWKTSLGQFSVQMCGPKPLSVNHCHAGPRSWGRSLLWSLASFKMTHIRAKSINIWLRCQMWPKIRNPHFSTYLFDHPHSDSKWCNKVFPFSSYLSQLWMDFAQIWLILKLTERSYQSRSFAPERL